MIFYLVSSLGNNSDEPEYLISERKMEVLSLAGTVFIGYNLIRFILYISKVTYYFPISTLPPPPRFSC